LAGQLVGSLGTAGALAVTRAGARLAGGLSASDAKVVAARRMADVVPPGSVFDTNIDEATRLAGQVPGVGKPTLAQATKSPAARTMGDVLAQDPGFASQQALHEQRMGERVAGTMTREAPAMGEPAVAQQAVRTSLAGEAAEVDRTLELGLAQIDGAHKMMTQPLQRAVDAAKAEAEVALGGAQYVGKEAAGQTIMEHINARREALRADVQHRLFGPLDEANPRIDITNLADPLEVIASRVGRTVNPDNYPPVLRNVLEHALDPDTNMYRGAVSFRELQEWRSELYGAAADMRKSTTQNTKAIENLTEMGALVDAALDNTLGVDPGTLGELYRAGNAAWKDIASRFDQGVVGALRQTGPRGEQMKVALENVVDKFLNGRGQGPIRSARDLRAAVGDDEIARQAFRDGLVGDFINKVYGADGLINPARARQWAHSYKDALSEWPEIQQEIGGMLRTTRTLEQAMGQAGTAGSIVDRWATNLRALAEKDAGAARQVIERSAASAYVGTNPSEAIKEILGKPDSVARWREVWSRIPVADVDARAGMRASFWGQFEASGVGPSGVAGFGPQPWRDPNGAVAFLDKHLDVAKEMYAPAALQRIREKLEGARVLLGRDLPERLPMSLTPEKIYTEQMWIGRIYQGAKGYLSKAFLVSEVTAHNVSSVLREFSDAQLRELYTSAWFNPDTVGRDLAQLGSTTLAPEKLVTMWRKHLFTMENLPMRVPRVRGHAVTAPATMGRALQPAEAPE